MSGWHYLQHRVQITTICLLLLISIPAPTNATKMRLPRNQLPHKEAATWKRMTSGNKVDIHRLYNAYRERLKDNGDSAINDAGFIAEQTAIAEESDIEKSTEVERDKPVTDKEAVISKVNKENKEETQTAKSLDIHNDAKNKDLISTHKEKYKDVEKEPKGSEKADLKKPEAILKMDMHSKDKVDTSKSPKPIASSQSTAAAKDKAECHVAKLSLDYKDIMRFKNRPTPESKSFNLLGEKTPYPIKTVPVETDFVSRPLRLSALNELMNVVENLKLPNTVDDIVKAINEEMNRESPNTLNKLTNLAAAYQTKRVQRDKDSSIVKTVASKLKDVQPDPKTGGLYERYKKKLDGILKANKQLPSKKEQISSSKDRASRYNDPRQCHCAPRNPLVLTINSDGTRVSNDLLQCHCEATRTDNLAINAGTNRISNGLTQCHCDATNSGSLLNACVVGSKPAGNEEYLKALKACMQVKENKLNGGLKPYYLSNSKHRQMVWNEVPLQRSGCSRKVEAAKPQIKNVAIKTEMKPSFKAGVQPNCKSNQFPKLKTQQTLESSSPNKNAPYSSTNNKHQQQLEHLLKVFDTKHRTNALRKFIKRGLIGMPVIDPSAGILNKPNNLAFPEVLVNNPVMPAQQTGGKMIEKMAKQMNVSPVEMAQHITSSAGIGNGQLLGVPSNLASQTFGNQFPNAVSNNKFTPESAQAQQWSANLGPMLEKILQRLQEMQTSDKDTEQGLAGKLPCCFAEPTDGTPCELTGSWESQLLGVRINIKDNDKITEESPKPTCYQPKVRRSSVNRTLRQCVKITPDQIKEGFGTYHLSGMKYLNITIQETLPPRAHDWLDNISEWTFTGHAVNTFGGPISLSCRRQNSNYLGNFVGYCRTCGCMDIIFGSWTFFQPSRDCQDISMSIVNRRDILRRYSLDDARRERFKNQLYRKSKFAKAEKNRQNAEKMQFEKVSQMESSNNVHIPL